LQPPGGFEFAAPTDDRPPADSELPRGRRVGAEVEAISEAGLLDTEPIQLVSPPDLLPVLYVMGVERGHVEDAFRFGKVAWGAAFSLCRKASRLSPGADAANCDVRS
jgi:hypothetical protein